MKKNSKRRSWIIGNEEDGCTLGILGLWVRAFLHDFSQLSGCGPYYHIEEFSKKGHFRWFIEEDYSLKIGGQLFEKVLANPKYFSKIRQRLAIECLSLYRFNTNVGRHKVEKVSSHELVKLFNEQAKRTQKIIGLGMISTLIDIPHSLFTNYLNDILAQHCDKINNKKNVSEYFSILSTVSEDTIQRQEVKSLLRLTLLVNSNSRLKKKLLSDQFLDIENYNFFSSFMKAVKLHHRKFCWAYYGYIGPAATIENVLSNIVSLLNDKRKPGEELKKMQIEKKSTLINIKNTEKELDLSKKECQIFQALRDTIIMKTLRKNAMAHSFFVFEPILREFARRVEISYEDAQYIAPGEYGEVLVGNKKIISSLANRRKYCVYSGATKIPHIYTGETAQKYLEQFYQEKTVEQVREIKGNPACLGKAKGIVRIINLPEDMVVMNKGDILVSIATTPDIVPAMKKAAAIITEQGGITSHAAIVSRELGIPCVIGTKIATKVLKDGDIVEVDAYQGIVTLLNK